MYCQNYCYSEKHSLKPVLIENLLSSKIKTNFIKWQSPQTQKKKSLWNTLSLSHPPLGSPVLCVGLILRDIFTV